MRIALVSPKGALYRHTGGILRRSLRYAPLTLTTLASLVPAELHADVTLHDEGIDDIDPELDADLIGLAVIHSERFEPRDGPLRPVVRRVVEQYLECGRLQNEFARLRCASCGSEHLLAFSCQTPRPE